MRVSGILVCSFFWFLGTVQAQVTYTSIATSGASVGGGLSIAQLDKNTPVSLTHTGQAAFSAEITGLGIEPGTTALLFGDQNNLQVVHINPRTFALARGGTIAVESDNQLWVGRSGQLQSVLSLDSLAASGPAGTVYNGSVEQLSVNNAGQFAFEASYSLIADPFTQGSIGIIKGSSAGAVLVAGSGMAAPGSNGRTFAGAGSPIINEAGQVAFAGYMDAQNPADNSGIWIAESGTLRPVAVSGQPAPQTGGIFRGVDYTSSINNSGTVGYRGWFEDPGSKIFIDQSGTGSLVGSPGQPAPGTTALFEHFIAPSVNDHGEIAFFAYVGPPEDHGAIYAGSPGNYRLIAILGQTAPGTAGRFDFDLLSPTINDPGQVMFTAFVANAAGEFVGAGLWATDLSGNLLPIVVEGTSMTLDGITRTVEDFTLIPSTMNNAGQVGFWVGFTDGTDAIVVATVPEPSAFVCFLLVSLGLVRRRQAAFRQI